MFRSDCLVMENPALSDATATALVSVCPWYDRCHLVRRMLILDVFVIYLACGAPFAVAAFLKPQQPTGFIDVLTSFGTVIYWPVLLPSAIRRVAYLRVSTMYSPEMPQADSSESRLRAMLAAHWSAAFGNDGLVTFRDSLERYAALCRELQGVPMPDGENELGSIAGHPDPELNSVCQERRNRRKLELHRTYARSEFIESVDQLALAGRSEAVTVARRLSEAVGDDEALAELETCSPQADKIAAAVG